MGFFNFINKQDVRMKKHTIKSEKDLGISTNSLIYIENEYDPFVNKFLSKNYNTINKKIYHYNKCGKLIYLPDSINDLFDNQEETLFLLKYYYPNIKIEDDYFDKIHGVINTPVFTNLVFSFLGYNESVTPGFLRLVEKRPDGLEYDYIYEFVQLDLSSDISLKKQVKHYIEQCFAGKSEDMHRQSRGFYGSFSDESGGSYSRLFGDYKKASKPSQVFEDAPGYFEKRKSHSKKIKSIEKAIFSYLFEEEEKEDKKDELKSKESELISRVREDILMAKDMGILGLLIKELGPTLFEDKEEIHKPSRLIVDDNFKIFLTDFDNMEIEMTPLPKTLFILFLRHTDGILLKHIHDYKKELLEIYKLLSYKEVYSDITESINRICNPTDGSINEKISRIKEAFLKKMSIDTAKYYIVTGERGQKKEIALNRSLLRLPPMFEEIMMTVTM